MVEGDLAGVVGEADDSRDFGPCTELGEGLLGLLDEWLAVGVVALAGEDDLDDGEVEVEFLLEESDCSFGLDVGADEAAGVQDLCDLWREWKGDGDGDHPDAHDQPVIAGGDFAEMVKEHGISFFVW